jgi:hypothetical protein
MVSAMASSAVDYLTAANMGDSERQGMKLWRRTWNLVDKHRPLVTISAVMIPGAWPTMPLLWRC